MEGVQSIEYSVTIKAIVEFYRGPCVRPAEEVGQWNVIAKVTAKMIPNLRLTG